MVSEANEVERPGAFLLFVTLTTYPKVTLTTRSEAVLKILTNLRTRQTAVSVSHQRVAPLPVWVCGPINAPDSPTQPGAVSAVWHFLRVRV